MNKISKLLLLVFLFVFSACVGTTPSKPIKPNQKAFEKEDAYILFALRAEQVKHYSDASSLFNRLYEKSDKKEYLYRSLQDDLAASKNKKILKRVDAIQGDKIEDLTLTRLKIVALVGLERFNKAKDLAIKLVGKTDSVDDYLLVSDVYIKLKKFDTAVKYLESAYVKNYNEKLLDRMAIVLYVNLGRKKDAIAQLETHSRINGCSKLICSRLVGFYSNDNNIDGLLSAYLRLYRLKANKKIARKIVQIYGYKKDYIKMMNFLEDSKSDDKTLLQLYINLKDYKKAWPLAYKLYKKTGEALYLGQSAIFEYEASVNDKDKVMQKSVIKKLKDTISKNRSGLYLNYLGYLLIDHEIDVKKGIGYVKEALKMEPKSEYYLDSLAWGYYKLNMCKKANKIMKKVVKMGGLKNEEVLSHLNMIKKCQKKKGKNKKR